MSGDPVKKIRIILTDLPAMLANIITEIIALEPDLILIDPIAEGTSLGAAAWRAKADVVITQQTGREGTVDRRALLYAAHPLKVIAISDDGRRALQCELRPHCQPLGELSAARLVAAIRAAAGGTE